MNIKTLVRSPRVRIAIAATLICCSFVFTAFAISKEQQVGADKCFSAYQNCVSNVCTAGRAAHGEGWYGRCTDYCYGKYTRCMDHLGLASMPKGELPSRIGGLPPAPTPTPRKGPGKISGLPESNPAATPRKGPGKVGSLPLGNPTPSATTSPTLRSGTGHASPSPSSSPKANSKKNHHH